MLGFEIDVRKLIMKINDKVNECTCHVHTHEHVHAEVNE